MSLVKFQVAEKRAAEYSSPHEGDLLLDSSSTATDSMGETDDLTAEFRAWRAETPATDLINLEEVSQAEDGVMSMVFSIDSRKFQLRCPGNYPHYEDDNFFVEAPSSLQLWCNGLILNALIPICPIDEMTFVFMNNDLFPIDSRG